MRVIADGTSIVKLLTRKKETRNYIRETKTSPADVIQFGGCKNYQTSCDTMEAVITLNSPTDG